MFFIMLGEFESYFISLELIVFLILIFLIFSLGSNKMSIDSEEGFECGFDGFSKEKMSFCVRFIKLAILFLLIDLEISILLPFFQKGWLNSFFVDFFLYSMVMIMFMIMVMLLLEWWGGGVSWSEEI